MRTTIDRDAISYDSETDTYRLHHSWWRDKPLSTAVSMGVAAVTNTAPTEQDPLFESVDPDALDRLFDSSAESTEHCVGRATFRFNDCKVTVYSNGTIEITPSE